MILERSLTNGRTTDEEEGAVSCYEMRLSSRSTRLLD